PTHRASTLPGYAAVAAAATLWAVAAVVARRLFDDGLSAVEVTESRAVLAAVGFALVPGVWRPAPGRSRASAFQLVALGVALALVNVTYYEAISRIPVAVALVIQYTAPALVVGWAAAGARRAPSMEVLVALMAALAGVVLVLEPGGAVARMDGTGIAMGVASAFFFATYTVLAERTGALYGSAAAMGRGFAVASLLWIAFQAPRGFPDELVEPAHLPEVLYLGVAGTLVPFFLFAWGVARVRAERAAIAATLEPVVAACVAWAWLDQSLSAVQLAGGALVIAAVAFLQSRERRPLVAPDV
ncbi:MAG: EamA family transporter, partial [Acidimicrobiales bacterium]